MFIRKLAHLWQRLRRNPASHWCALIVVLAATVGMHDNNANPFSRYALLSAIAEDHSLAIDAYRYMTCDWARTPDGRYYSNKAPGPALLALPVFLPLDAFVAGHAADRKARDARRTEARDAMLDILAVVLQAIPFAIVVMMGANMLAAAGASRLAIELAALAMLFGNTASLLMNMFYGHGMAALLTLGMVLALCERRLFLVGLLFGLDVLCDYGSALFLPVLGAIVLWPSGREGNTRRTRLLRIGLGGLGPLLLFAGYHLACFGGPFTLPSKFQNPVFVEAGRRALWGVIDLLPNPHIVYALLFGTGRSLLVTQPWVLVLAASLVLFAWRRRGWSEPRKAMARTVLPLAFGGLALLFLMNASFGGWHGGVCPGPRYLAAALPVVGFALGLSYDSLPRPARMLLWLTVLSAVLLFAIIWAGDVAVWPTQEIWPRCRETLFKFALVKTYLRLAWILVAFALTALVAVLRARWARAYRVST